jgi:DHA3 family macrolide efflux protein-like MFS transporter
VTTKLEQGSSRNSFIEALEQREVALLFIGQLLSQFGDQFLAIAGFSMIIRLSSSTLLLSGLALSFSLPQLLLGLLGGVYVDRLNRKTVMIAADVARGLLVLPVLWANARGELWVLYPVAASMVVAGVFFYPARNATIPNIVEPRLLLPANVLIQASYILSLIFGATAAGLVVGQWGPDVAILFDSVTFFISAACITLMRIPANVRQQIHARARDVQSELAEGMQYIWRHPFLKRILIITAVAALGISAIMILGIKWLQELLGRHGSTLKPETGFGIAMAAMGLGVALGGLFVQRLADRLPVNQVVGACLSLAGVAIISFALAPNFVLVLVAAAALGLCIVVARAGLATLTHQLVPDRVRGRVESAVNMVAGASMAAAQGLAGVLAVPSLLGVQGVFVSAGIVTLAAGLGTFYALDGAVQAASAQDA